LRSTHVLLLILLGFLLFSIAGKARVSASGTGIGIRVQGPSQAQINQTISYSITVINLGDYWDRNLTVTDKFPNGTSLSWKVPDLAPLGQEMGYEYTISGISYSIGPTGVLSQPSPRHIDNNATVAGYVYVSVSNVTVPDAVQAETSFPTIISALAVGGYSISIEPADLLTLTITYVSFVFAIIAASVYLRFKFKQTK